MLRKIFVACAIVLACGTASASELPAYPFIHVSGNADAWVPVDIGTIDFEILASDADPAAARAVLEARISAVRTLAEQHGLALDDLEVRDVTQELAKPQPGVTTPIYELRCSVHINVRDLSKWKTLAGGLLGMTNLSSFAVAFDSTTREAAEATLMAAAIDEAKKRAQNIAAGFGRKLGPVTAVSSGPLRNLGTAMGLFQADFRSQSNSRSQQVYRDNLLQVVPLRLSQPVDVIFRIKP